jgi:subtilisin-like proprotein convertase family protein
MKKIYFLAFLSLCFYSRSQIFTGTGGPILNNGGQETYFTLPVSGLNNVDTLFGLEAITIDVTHPEVEELEISLISPSGVEVTLTGVYSCKGTNYVATTFKNGSAGPITSVSAPYTGTFSPIGNLGRFNTNVSPNGNWKLSVKDFIAGANSGTVTGWSLQFSNTPAKPVMLASSNLPLVFINTPNNQKLSEADMVVSLGIINNGSNRNNITDTKNEYNGKANCHLRGSSSRMFEKNNIKIELKDASGTLDNPVALLGMPAESDWVLTSGYSDKSLIRNALTQNVFAQMGHYAPRYRYVELFYNNEYFGVYLLMEQVKRGADRVKIQKMTSLDNQFPYLTGGYIIQINRTDDPGYYSLLPGVSGTSAKFYYQYNYPKADEITVQQMNYIKAFTDTFETVMNSANFNDPVTGYKKYIEDGSFVDYFILTELAKNVDGYRLSTYLYKDNYMDGGKLHIGPTWDYDIAWHNANYGNAFDDKYWEYQNPDDFYPPPTWWGKFLSDQAFKDKLYCRYHSLRQNVLSNASLYQYIDATAAMLDESQKRNYRQFPIIGTYIFPNPQSQAGATYATEVADLKQWIANRTAWMDANIPGFCANIGFEERMAGNEMFDVFPNPFSNSVSVKYSISKTSRVKLELYNMLGDRVVAITEDKLPGQYTYEVSTEKLRAGTYVLKMDVDGKQSHKKIIKL